MSAPKRCAHCQKKLGLSDFACRCGGIYCTLHRPDYEHKCTYDYKAQNVKALSTIMKVVVAEKVAVI